MRVIVATEKTTGRRFGYCVVSGIGWFAPGLCHLAVARWQHKRAAETIENLRLLGVAVLFRKENDGTIDDPEMIRLDKFSLTIEDPAF
jgi:hypothetical protein